MHILLIGRDRQGVDPHSALSDRWRGLVKQGAELTVLLLCEQVSTWQEPGIRMIGVGGSRFVQRLWRAYQAGRLLQGIDLISAQDPAELGGLAYLLGKRIGARVEMQDHGGWFDGSRWIDEPLWFLRKRCADWLLPRVDAIRTVNPQSFDQLSKRIGKRAYFLPIACAEHFFQANYRPIPGRFVCVARFVPVKRHELLLKAFALVVKSQPDASLTLVGSGPLESRLRTLVQGYGLEEKVQFVRTNDASPHLEVAQRFVLLSSHEGWGVAAVEAAAVGVPVLMTNTGCAPWLKKRGLAHIIMDLEPASIATSLLENWSVPVQSNELPRMTSVQREQVVTWRRLLL